MVKVCWYFLPMQYYIWKEAPKIQTGQENFHFIIFLAPVFLVKAKILRSGLIDAAKFYVRVSFSFFDRTFETKLPGQSPAGVKTGILKKRMKQMKHVLMSLEKTDLFML